MASSSSLSFTSEKELEKTWISRFKKSIQMEMNQKDILEWNWVQKKEKILSRQCYSMVHKSLKTEPLLDSFHRLNI